MKTVGRNRYKINIGAIAGFKINRKWKCYKKWEDQKELTEKKDFRFRKQV